jgi:hypothetical protein
VQQNVGIAVAYAPFIKIDPYAPKPQFPPCTQGMNVITKPDPNIHFYARLL